MRYPKLCLMMMILFVTYYSSSCRIIEDSINSANIPQIDDPAIEFMKNFDIPELSIAVTKDDKLVYAKAFSQNDTVSVNNRFRIASVSKPFTAITVFKLIEEGKLKMTDKVFGKGGVLGTKFGTQPYGRWITDLTVYNLLSHTSGGWTALDANDPMLQFPSWPVAKLITWTLDNYPLSVEPGTQRIYSNFGYCLLGRIIEEVTGQSYEHYVRSAILEPVGITDMWIAGNTLADRRPGEVIYYSGNTSDPTEDPYTSINIHRMDSHGGWIATAKDLVRLLVHVTPDILDHETFKTMTTPISLAPEQALGWGANETNQWCAGSLPGNLAYMIRTSELGYNWSILMNTRYLTHEIEVAIESLVWGAIRDPTTQWPTTDSFLEKQYRRKSKKKSS